MTQMTTTPKEEVSIRHKHNLLRIMAKEWCEKNMIDFNDNDLKFISKKVKNKSGNEFYKNNILLISEEEFINIKFQIKLDFHTKNILLDFFGNNKKTIKNLKPLLKTM